MHYNPVLFISDVKGQHQVSPFRSLEVELPDGVGGCRL